jgi:hypothetical protein
MKGIRRFPWLRCTLAVGASLLIAGCAGTPTPAPTPTSPEITPAPGMLPTPDEPLNLAQNWREYRQSEDGFAVSLPPSWHKFDVNAETLSVALPALGVQNPALIALISREAGQRSRSGSEIHFFAFDLTSDAAGTGFMTNLNILHQPLTLSMGLSEFGAVNVRELEQVAQLARPVLQEQAILPAGRALRLSYQLVVDLGDNQRLDLSLVQYLLVRGREGYVITFATMPGQCQQYEATFERIAGTFRWLAP